MIEPNDSSEAEFKRILEVSQLDLDYQNLQEMFKNLTELASGITGAELSLVIGSKVKSDFDIKTLPLMFSI